MKVERITEALIVAVIPILAGVLWMVPKIEGQLEANALIQNAAMVSYSSSMDKLSDQVEKSTDATNRMQVSIAVLENNVSRIEVKVDSIDDIANTKVKTIEGRLGVMEYKISDLRGR